MLFIDSSVVVKCLSMESNWEKAAEYTSQSVTIPLALVEIGSALARKVMKNEMDLDTARKSLELYSKAAILLDQTKYISSAFDIALANGSSVYDSLFIATALGEGCDLVSCDEKQIMAAEKLGVKTIRC